MARLECTLLPSRRLGASPCEWRGVRGTHLEGDLYLKTHLSSLYTCPRYTCLRYTCPRYTCLSHTCYPQIHENSPGFLTLTTWIPHNTPVYATPIFAMPVTVTHVLPTPIMHKYKKIHQDFSPSLEYLITHLSPLHLSLLHLSLPHLLPTNTRKIHLDSSYWSWIPAATTPNYNTATHISRNKLRCKYTYE